jgi:hypothetical protein
VYYILLPPGKGLQPLSLIWITLLDAPLLYVSSTLLEFFFLYGLGVIVDSLSSVSAVKELESQFQAQGEKLDLILERLSKQEE